MILPGLQTLLRRMSDSKVKLLVCFRYTHLTSWRWYALLTWYRCSSCWSLSLSSKTAIDSTTQYWHGKQASTRVPELFEADSNCEKRFWYCWSSVDLSWMSNDSSLFRFLIWEDFSSVHCFSWISTALVVFRVVQAGSPVLYWVPLFLEWLYLKFHLLYNDKIPLQQANYRSML